MTKHEWADITTWGDLKRGVRVDICLHCGETRERLLPACKRDIDRAMATKNVQ